MMGKPMSQRGEEMARRTGEARGSLQPEREWAIRQAPEFAGAYDRFYRQALGTDEGLAPSPS
jgi:hypothetical protein